VVRQIGGLPKDVLSGGILELEPEAIGGDSIQEFDDLARLGIF